MNVDKKVSFASKRTFIKAGIGSSTAFLLMNGVTSANSPNMVEVPAHLHDGEPIRYMKVEEDWKIYSDRVKRVLDSVKARYLSDHRVFMIEETSGSERLSGTKSNKPEITVYAEKPNSISELRNFIPSQLDGVRINRKDFPGSINTAYNGTYEPVPGGVEAKDSDSTFTATCKVTHDGGNRFLLVRHPFIGSTDDAVPKHCETSFTSDGYYCFQGSDIFGKTYADWQEHDVVVIFKDLLTEKATYAETIVDELGGIKGTMSPSRLDYLKDNSSIFPNVIRKRGITTGARTGEVLGTNGSFLCSGEGQQMEEIVRTSNLQLPGDSGGPRYERFQVAPLEYELFMLGPATQADDNSNSQGVAAWYLNQETGMIFS